MSRKLQVYAPFRVCNLYQCALLLGSGGYGYVYHGISLIANDHAALKMRVLVRRDVDAKKTEHLEYEAAIYAMLRGVAGIPTMRWYGEEYGLSILIMDCLGPTLNELRRFCRGRFTLRTVCMLAEQLITRVEDVHERGVIIRDIKPSNIAMGYGKFALMMYLFDFGLSRNYIDPDTGKHIPMLEDRSRIGTRQFSSVNMQNGKEASRRDDLECLAYTLVYLLHGDLPWMTAQGDEIARMKQGTAFRQLLDSSAPELAKFFDHVKGLAFEQRPNYAYLRELFRRRMGLEGWACDWMYDWMGPKHAGPLGTMLPKEYCVNKEKLDESYILTY